MHALTPDKLAAELAREICDAMTKRAGISRAQRRELKLTCCEVFERAVREDRRGRRETGQRGEVQSRRNPPLRRPKRATPPPLAAGEDGGAVNLVGVVDGLPFVDLIAENCAGLVKSRALRASRKYGVDMDDAIGHGFVALQRAARSFDQFKRARAAGRRSAGRVAKFTTYATTAIDREIVKNLVGDPGRPGTLVPEGVRTYAIEGMKRGGANDGDGETWTPEADCLNPSEAVGGASGGEMREVLRACAVRVAGPHMATLAIEAAVLDRGGSSDIEIASTLGVSLAKAREAVTKGRTITTLFTSLREGATDEEIEAARLELDGQWERGTQRARRELRAAREVG